jgi:hypothetical protein
MCMCDASGTEIKHISARCRTYCFISRGRIHKRTLKFRPLKASYMERRRTLHLFLAIHLVFTFRLKEQVTCKEIYMAPGSRKAMELR